MPSIKSVHSYLFLFLCYFALPSHAVTSFEYLEFQSLSTDKGLSQKTVQAILQDSHGFIWIGTQEGLNRYDGKSIITYRNSIEDSQSLSSNVIQEILEDSQGNIWVATSGGLNKYDATKNVFEQIALVGKNGQPIKKTYSLTEAKNGNILVGTDGHGIFSVNPSNDNVHSSLRFNALSTSDVRVILQDSRGRNWIGTDGHGVWLFDPTDQLIKNFLPIKDRANSLSHNRIRAIFEDSNGHIWIGTRGGGLNKYDELNKTFTHYKTDENYDKSISNDRVYKIIEDQSRSLWIATDGGINIFSSATNEFTTITNHPSQPSSLNNNRVLTLFEDSGGLVWIGTFSGVNIWNPTTAKFIHHRNISEDKNSLTNNTVFGLAATKDNQIYAATFGGGLNYFKPTTGQWKPITNSENGNDLDLDSRLMSLLIDDKEQLWIGSFSKGITVLSKHNQLIKRFSNDPTDPSSLSSNAITNIFQDNDGEIWISTYGAGINRLTRNGDNFIRYRMDSKNNKGPKSDGVFQVIEDDEGYIWMATDGGGISRLDKNTGNFINFTHEPNNKESLTGDTAWSIFQDSRGRFWIGTQGRGLNRWEPENRRQRKNIFKRYTSQNGLPSSTINGVLEDDQGYIWISTNKGVSRLDPESDTIQNFDLALEIHDNELNQGAMVKSNNGRLYFGGLNGISAFSPNDIAINLHTPKVRLTNIYSQGKQLSLEDAPSNLKEVRFSHMDYLVTFEFAAFDFSQPSRNQYQYQLDGFDPNWILNGNSNRATYTNLPSGSYIFKAKGSNNDGVWSDDNIAIKVIVDPAPWASWWAFTLYILAFCFVLIFAIHYQAKRIASQESFRNKINRKSDQKILLLEKDNSSLREKIEEMQSSSARDHVTGLFNKDFFTEQLVFCLDWLNRENNQINLTNQKLYCIFINLGNGANDDRQKDEATKLARTLQENEPNLHLHALWGNNQIALIALLDSHKSLQAMVSRLVGINSQYNIGFVTCPLFKQDKMSFQWDYVLLLTEHILRTTVKNRSLKTIGLLSSYQRLSSANLKEVLKANDIANLERMFEVYSN